MIKCDAAVITNSKTGINLSINIDEKDYKVALYDVDAIIDGRVASDRIHPERNANIRNTNIQPVYDIDTLMLTLKKPSVVFLIGDTSIFAEQMLSLLAEKLDPGDIVIDCCNSYFEDTAQRTRNFENRGIYYLGTGFSGGEEEALIGPSLLVGGSRKGYSIAEGVLKDVCSRNLTGELYLGPDGTGQFVKMVHDAILWAVSQLIAEHIGILRAGINCNNDELHNILCDWNSKETLNSLLLDIIADITSRVDNVTHSALIDLVSDVVSFDLSSYWVGKSAMLLGVPVPTLLESINVRYLSYMKNERQNLSKSIYSSFMKIPGNDRVSYISRVESSLYMSICCAYTQGFELISKASDMYGWGISLSKVAESLRRGSYIRSRILERIADTYNKNNNNSNLFLDKNFLRNAVYHLSSLRKIVSYAAEGGIPMSATFSALSYIDTLSKSILPTGIIQLCQDYIHGTGYEKLDEEGVFYADWKNPSLNTRSIKFKT